jgi:H+-transporting ATPase
VIFQQILNYTLRSVASKILNVLFLAAGLLMTGHAILTPMLMIIVMVAGDFLGMSATTDNVRPSPQPNRWLIRNLTFAGIFLGISELAFSITVLAIGHFKLRLGIASLQTLTFFTVVCASQASCYAIRARGRIWSWPHPGRWVALASAIDLLLATTLASRGWLMAPLPLDLLLAVLGVAIACVLVLDVVRIPVFKRLHIE